MSTPELPSTPAAAPVPPANDATSPETSSLTDAFLSGGLPFQSAETPAAEGQAAAPAAAQTAVPPIQDSDDANDTFAAQAERNGWNAAQPASQPAQAAVPQQTTQPSALPPEGLYLPTGQRNYAGLTPEEVVIFKEMNRASYEKLRPMYHRHKELEAEQQAYAAKMAEMEKLTKELKGQHFYDLPDAWQLDPEIRPLAENQQSLAAEADFWQRQLAAIDRQERIQLIVAGQDGKPMITAPMDPEPEHRAQITRAMQDALAKHTQISAALTQNVQSFKARYQGWDDMVSEQTNRVFGKFEKHIAPSRDAILKEFPAALRHKPIYHYAANATAALAMLLKDNETLKKQLAGRQLNQPALASATPKPTAAPTGKDHLSALEYLSKMSGKGIVVPRG